MGDVSCRIVVVASSLDKGALLVKNISLINERKKNQHSSSFPVVSVGSTEPVIYPWSISNRYYTADVYFALHTVSKVYGAVFDGVPALIVAWTKGEPFEEYMDTIQKAMEGHDPEILLAVRLPGNEQEPLAAKERGDVVEEDNNSIDARLISYGFEYIDASENVAPDTGPVAAEGIPHLPRVIDALSTIMWPSMSSNTPAVEGSSNARGFERSQLTLEAIINSDPLAILQVLKELDSQFDFDPEDEDTEFFKEALQGYNSSPISDSGSPNWTHSSSETSGTSAPDGFAPVASPTSFLFDDTDDAFGLFSDATLGSGKKPQISLGFEDDFTVFVSAAVDDVNVVDHDFSHLRLDDASGRNTPDEESLHSGDLTPRGPFYHSLGSSTDLNSVEDG